MPPLMAVLGETLHKPTPGCWSCVDLIMSVGITDNYLKQNKMAAFSLKVLALFMDTMYSGVWISQFSRGKLTSNSS